MAGSLGGSLGIVPLLTIQAAGYVVAGWLVLHCLAQGEPRADEATQLRAGSARPA